MGLAVASWGQVYDLIAPESQLLHGVKIVLSSSVPGDLVIPKAGLWQHFLHISAGQLYVSWAFCLSQVFGEPSSLTGNLASLSHPKRRERGSQRWQHAGHCHVAQCQGAWFTWTAVRFVPPGAVRGRGHWLPGIPLAQVRVPSPHSSWTAPVRSLRDAAADLAEPCLPSHTFSCGHHPARSDTCGHRPARSLFVLFMPSRHRQDLLLGEVFFPRAAWL